MNATSVSPSGASPLLLRGLGHATRFDVRAACAGLIVSGVLVLGCGDAAGGPSVDLDGSVALPDADHEDLGSNVDLGRPQDLGADDLGMAHDAGVDMCPTLPPPPDWYEPGAPHVTDPAQLETWRYHPTAGMRSAGGAGGGCGAAVAGAPGCTGTGGGIFSPPTKGSAASSLGSSNTGVVPVLTARGPASAPAAAAGSAGLATTFGPPRKGVAGPAGRPSPTSVTERRGADGVPGGGAAGGGNPCGGAARGAIRRRNFIEILPRIGSASEQPKVMPQDTPATTAVCHTT